MRPNKKTYSANAAELIQLALIVAVTPQRGSAGSPHGIDLTSSVTLWGYFGFGAFAQ